MNWDRRLGILVGLVVAIAALLYFKVFQPTGAEPEIPIEATEPASEPVDLFLPELGPTEPAAGVSPLPPAAPPEPVLVEPEPVAPPVPEPDLSPVITTPPEPVPEPPLIEIEPIIPQPRSYVVKEGDSLWSIAGAQLGDPTRHEEIFKLNREILKGSPDNLKVGERLILPSK